MDATALTIGAAVAAPVLAFSGSLSGSLLARRGDRELDRWRRREETMRLMRWATELSVSSDEEHAAAGIVTLTALLDSTLLDADDVDMVTAIVRWVARRADYATARSIEPDSPEEQ